MSSHRTLSRTALLAAAGLLAATLTAAPSAHALPVFTEHDMDIETEVHDDAGCTANDASDPDQNDVPVAENGPATTVTASSTGTATDGALDTQTAVVKLTATGSVASSGANISSMAFDANGTAAVANTVADSVCLIHAYTEADLEFEFTVTTPGFLTFTRKARGAGMYTEFYISGELPSDNPYHDTYGQGLLLETTDVLYLPAGNYEGYFDADMTVLTDKAVNRSASVAMRATFAPAGSQQAAAAGKGKKYVSLPATARSCAADSITASVTTSKKRAKLIKQVTFSVNGKKAATVKKPKKGQSVVLTGIADSRDAEVRAVAKLVKKANGKPRKPVEVTASYVACSPPTA